MSELVHVHPTPSALAAAVADALVARLLQVQGQGRVPSVVLTGGSVSREVHRALRDRGTAVDWSKVEVWWGDERYVARDSEDRNAGQARADLLDHVPVDAVRVHEMPADDGAHPSLDAAAASYDAELKRAVVGRSPWFDVVMLGIGPDGHCASLFPGFPQVHAAEAVVAVEDSPKPPPRRVSLGMSALGNTGEVWFVAAGAEKAPAVAASRAGGDVDLTPAAQPRGLDRTVWWLDEAAQG